VTDLVFVETEEQAVWVSGTFSPSKSRRVIAMTAEALEALERLGVDHEAICEHSTAHELATVTTEELLIQSSHALARELDVFFARHHRHLPCDGPGLICAQLYYLQYSVAAIARRTVLMRDAMVGCSAKAVTMFAGPVDRWFDGDGYTRNPWIDAVERVALRQGISVEVISEASVSIPRS